MQIRALVVDDEIPAREELMFMLQAGGRVNVVGECEDGEEVLEFLRHKPVDIVFLDIHMRIQSGLSAAWQIMQLAVPPKIIFTTGYSEYAQQAFELNAIDYVMKPYVQERIDKAVDKAFENVRIGVLNQHIQSMIYGGTALEAGRLPVWKNERLLVLPYHEIAFVKSSGKRTTSITSGKDEYTTQLTLRDLEMRLKPPKFLRTHKSYIVNLDKVVEIIPWFNHTYLLRLEECEEQVPVTRHYIKTFQMQMGLA